MSLFCALAGENPLSPKGIIKAHIFVFQTDIKYKIKVLLDKNRVVLILG